MRAPNHLGDVVMALPALLDAGADVMVLERLVPVLEMASFPGRIHPLRRGRSGFVDAARRLRRAGYRDGVLLTPSFGAALLFRAGGVRRLRGTATDARGLLLSDPVPTERLGGMHRILQYRLLLGAPVQDDPGPDGRRRRCARLEPPPDELAAWARRLGIGAGSPTVALFPGSNAPARRWPAERFAELGRRLTDEGRRVVVLGGRGERELTAAVSRAIPGSVDAGGRTDLPGLAAVLSLVDALVTNDTGPMHLAGLLGTPTVTVWGSSDPAEVRPVGAPHHPVTLEVPLPCMPCRKNRCPRSGPGYRTDTAAEECLRLVGGEPVLEALRRALVAPGSGTDRPSGGRPAEERPSVGDGGGLRPGGRRSRGGPWAGDAPGSARRREAGPDRPGSGLRGGAAAPSDEGRMGG